MKTKQPLLGFIGQGWIGKNYSDDFEQRGYTVVRYSKEAPYSDNKDKLKECDIIFIAVPTPTTPEGFDDSILREVVPLAGKGASVVIKSTIVPGTTESIQAENPDIFLFHSPEFLSVASAAHDAAHPERNIVGFPIDTPGYRERAREILSVLPQAPFELVCTSPEAELIKYLHNCHGYTKVIFFNLVYDMAKKLDCNWDVLHSAILADSMIANWHITPVHKSGRGAGGFCLLKDFQSFTDTYKKLVPEDTKGHTYLDTAIQKNLDLLISSHKDYDLIEGIYGDLDALKKKLDI